MKRLIFVLWGLLMVLMISAQHQVSGKVLDEQGQPLIGAAVVLGQHQWTTISGIDGGYILENVAPGTYRMMISYLGYYIYTHSIAVTGDLVNNVTLVTKTTFTDEIVVSAIRASVKTPVAFTNLTKQELKTLNMAEDVTYVLGLTPSAVATSEAGIGIGYTNLRIRGTDPTRINVTIDGIPLNDAESQGVFWVDLPDFTSSVEEVQIQRGVGTSSNGAAAFGASINLRTNKTENEPSAMLSSTVGSFNTLKNNIKVNSGLLNNRFSFEARYSDIQSDGYVKHSGSNHQSLFLSGAMHLPQALLKMNVIHGVERTGISWWGVPADSLKVNRRFNPAGVYFDDAGNQKYYQDQTDNYVQTHYHLVYIQEFSPSFNMSGALHYTKGKGYYEQFKEDESVEEYGWEPVMVNGQMIDETDLINQKWMDNHFYGFTWSSNYSFGLWNASVGTGWNRYDGDHYGEVIWSRLPVLSEKGERWYLNNGTKTDYQFFAKVNWQPSTRFLVYGDVQFRGIDYKLEGRDDDWFEIQLPLDQQHEFRFFNPKAGVTYSLNNKHQWYASVGISNREPSRTDFKMGRGDAAATPKPERLVDFEGGYHYRSPLFSANINLFFMNYKDQLVPTGQKSNVGYDIMTNVDESYRAGVELIWGAKLLPRLSWDGNLTLSSNKIKNFIEYSTAYSADYSESMEWITPLGTTDIAYSPNVVGASTLSYKPMKNMELGFVSKYVGAQFFDNTSDQNRKLDAYFINNLRAKYEFHPSWVKAIGVQLQVNNLFNVVYENNAYGGNWYEANNTGGYNELSWAYYYPQAGTHFLTRIYLEF
jgi:iron complex outermembrane receptor protein